MTAHLGLYSSRNGPLLADDTGRLTKLVVSTNVHGFESCQIAAPMPLTDAFRRYDWVGSPNAIVRADGTVAFDGRIEDTAIRSTGVEMTAFGYQRALSDSPYTAVWTKSTVEGFRPLTSTEVANRTPELYKFDTNNRINITLPQGSIYGTGADVGTMIWQKPEGGSRQLIGCSFDAVVNLPNGWQFVAIAWTAGFGVAATAVVFASLGATQAVNKFYTFVAADYFSFDVFNNTGANYLVNNAPNVWFVNITNVRLVTTTTNKVDTTTTGAVGAGAGVSVPVVTSARMYAGQRLHIGAPAANGIPAVVTSVPDATHFVADLSAAVGAGVNIQAHVVYADEIVKDLIATVSTLNSSQLSSSTQLVQSPSLDLLDESYEDMKPSDILNRLIGLGDNQTTPRQWEWGVYENQQLFFQYQGFTARTWYVDISALELQRTLDQMYNSAYAVYQEQGGRTLRGAVSTASASVSRYGVTRRQAVNVSTTSLTQANAQRDAVLNDADDPPPRFGITFEKVFTASGGAVPLWIPRAGDTIVIRNLPPTISVAIDSLRTFRIARTSCDLIAGHLSVEPETPLPTLSAMLSRAAPPSWVTAPWWVQIQQQK